MPQVPHQVLQHHACQRRKWTTGKLYLGFKTTKLGPVNRSEVWTDQALLLDSRCCRCVSSRVAGYDQSTMVIRCAHTLSLDRLIARSRPRPGTLSAAAAHGYNVQINPNSPSSHLLATRSILYQSLLPRTLKRSLFTHQKAHSKGH